MFLIFKIMGKICKVNFKVNKFPAIHTDFMQFTPEYSEWCEIHTIYWSTIHQCFQITDHQQRTLWISSKSTRFSAFCPQFLWTTQNSCNQHPWPVNLTESSELLEITANYPNYAQSAPSSGEYCEIRTFCT